MQTFIRLSGIFIALILASELFVRAVLTLPSASTSDPELGWKYTPYSTIFHTSEGWAVNHMNSMGLNDDEPVLNSEKRRIIVLGDSLTEALQVPRSENFTSVAETIAPCLDVYNSGRSGLSPIHYPIVLSRVRKHIVPELAIVALSSSDISDLLNSKNYEPVRNAVDNRIISLHIKEKPLTTLRIWLDPIISRSALATYLMRRIKAMSIKNKDTNDPANKELSDVDDAYIIELLEYLFSSMNTQVPVAVLYIQRLDYGEHRISTVGKQSAESESLIRNAAREAGVPFLSTRSYMKSSYQENGQPGTGFSNKNILAGHLNRLGHQATALALYDLVAAAGLKCRTAEVLQ